MKSYSLTWRIIAAVAACQLLLAVGLSLVAILYARTQLRGTFDNTLFRASNEHAGAGALHGDQTLRACV